MARAAGSRKILLYSSKSTGGEIAEMFLRRSGLPFEVEYLDYEKRRTNKKFLKLNPLHQFPVMILPSGELMTETLAIAFYLNEKASMGLIPPSRSKDFPRFLRWAVFLVGSVYPTFTYADTPERWTKNKKARKEVGRSIDAFRSKMWKHMDRAASARGPYFMGRKQTLIDFYLVEMTLWRPGRAWFERNAPRIYKIAMKMESAPEYRAVRSVR